ncbi:MAG TPA: ferrochelatase [Rhodobacteraceae bacterium]|nr:ferrochelatase [Paracoccaceae bacterium]
MAPTAPRTGVLLVNLGTPEATDYWSMRRYLKQFLSDRRVVETPRLLWWPILNGIILTLRPGRSGKAYERIWNRERNESPLKTITRAQSEKLAARMTTSYPDLLIDWAMRYGQPDIAGRIDALMRQGAEKILLFPLYPQYSASTTATVVDDAMAHLRVLRAQPAMRCVPPFPDDPAYIGALAASVKTHLATLDWRPQALLASFHGLPKAYVDKGDPYAGHCRRTAAALQKALGWEENRFYQTFQSRMGRAEWLRPSTDETVEKLAREGVRRLAILTPGFVADCVETLEEIALGTATAFTAAGGQHFAFIPCLNDSTPGIDMLEAVVLRELQGWI